MSFSTSELALEKSSSQNASQRGHDNIFQRPDEELAKMTRQVEIQRKQIDKSFATNGAAEAREQGGERENRAAGEGAEEAAETGEQEREGEGRTADERTKRLTRRASCRYPKIEELVHVGELEFPDYSPLLRPRTSASISLSRSTCLTNPHCSSTRRPVRSWESFHR